MRIWQFTRSRAFASAAALALLGAFFACTEEDDQIEYEAKVLIEHNDTDQDTGFQIFFDWEPWRTLTVTGPGGDVLEVEAQLTMAGYGLTEMFFETNEPPADEVPRDQVLALLPAGEYTFEGVSTEGDNLSVTARLTHDIPEAAEILSPEEEAEVDPEQPVVVSWSAVSQSLEGQPVNIVAYQLVVAPDLNLADGEGFFELTFSVHVPGDVTSMPISSEYLRPGTPYEFEVLALEESGNQTIAVSAFETTGDPIDDQTEVPEPGPTELAASKYLIEHNATDNDTGYQIFLDGQPWDFATVIGPSEGILEVSPDGELAGFGLTEMFFETNEPPADEVPLGQVLALFPEGSYDFQARAVEEGTQTTGAATLSHTIAEATVITSPAEDAEVDAAAPLAVSWTPVTTSLDGGAVNIVAYQLIVVKAEEALPPSAGFFKPTLSAHVPADTTSVTVAAEFLEPGSEYEIEVLALEESGNQTISIIAFETR